MPRKFTDLTLVIDEGMQTFPTHWHPFVEITQLGRHGLENRETRKIVLGTHTGTHMDAPRHFIPDGMTVDQVPLSQLVGEAVMANLAHVGARGEVSKDMLLEALDGRWAERIVLRFDWSDRLGTMSYYNDCPYLTEEAAQWLVESGVGLVAMDTPMPDDPRNGKGSRNDSPIHHIFLGHNVIIVEYLTNLKNVKSCNFDLVVAPLNIARGDGAPVRCFSIEDE